MDLIMCTEKITVQINKQETALDQNTTVSQLLQLRGLRKAAVWINGRQLLKSEYTSYTLQEGDRIKLLRIMAGG